MKTQIETDSVSKKKLWVSRILIAVPVLFMLIDGITKLMMIPPVMEASKRLGFQPNIIPVIGIILLVCTILYLIPRTSILGAVLLTGYLGGAVVTNLRIESPLFSNTLFPVYFGILIWGGLYLKDSRLSIIFPLHKM
ncbi:MAG: DoxX family protein [Ignavibacteriaceae bacterium]